MQLDTQNKDLQYRAIWSNECIEFWFVLHFAYYTANNDRSSYNSFLNAKFTELGLGKYEKNMQNIFEILLEYGKPEIACKYAERIIKENRGKPASQIAPGTLVYQAVRELAKYLPERYRGRF